MKLHSLIAKPKYMLQNVTQNTMFTANKIARFNVCSYG